MLIYRPARLSLIHFSLVLIGSAASQDAFTWKSKFDEIFGQNTGGSTPMPGTQLMRTMMFLHDTAYGPDSIDPEDRAKADFWFEKVFGFTTLHDNIGECNADFLRSTFEMYNRQNVNNNPNFEQLYLTFQGNIFEFCIRHFTPLPSVFVLDKVSENKLAYLLEKYTKINPALSVRDSATIMIRPVLQSIGVGRKASEVEVTRAWADGPCQMISSTLQQPEMKHYSDFVDMCAEDPKNFQAHSSEPMRFWVNIVMMCRHIDTLIPYIIENIKIEEAKAVELWKKTYDEIFAPIENVASMSKPRLLHSLMYLHAKADRLKTVDESDKKIVEFWFDSLIELDIHDCNVDFVHEMTDLYNRQNHFGNPNFEQLFVSFRKTLVDFCDSRFLDLPDKLGSRISNADLLDFLASEMDEDRILTPTTPSPFSNPDLAERLAESAIRSCEAGNRGTAVLNDWRQGPCEVIQSTLREPSLRQYSDFVDLSLLDKRDYLEHCSINNYIWVKAVHVCRILDRWIPYFAESDSLASMVRQVIRHNFDINSLDDMMETPIPSTDSPSGSGSNAVEPRERVISVVSSTPSTSHLEPFARPSSVRSTSFHPLPEPRMRRRRS